MKKVTNIDIYSRDKAKLEYISSQLDTEIKDTISRMLSNDKIVIYELSDDSAITPSKLLKDYFKLDLVNQRRILEAIDQIKFNPESKERYIERLKTI